MIIMDNFCQDGSDEGLLHMVSMRNKKNYPLIITKYLSSRALIYDKFVYGYSFTFVYGYSFTFSTIFTKDNYFCHFLSASLDDTALPKWILLGEQVPFFGS